jgi:N-acetylmuramoyl-L-alanine amidase
VIKKKIVFITILIFFSWLVSEYDIENNRTHAFSTQIIRRGASGNDVIELQSRLKYIGFYNGKIDGAFGWGTYWALRNFQSKFGMPVDGIAGAQTKARLVKVTKYTPPAKPAAPAASTPGGFSQNDIKLMSNAVYGESRGEPYTGQVAVAAVILNRVQSASFPNTVSGVIFEPGAFTAVADGQIWLTPNENARKAVLDAINGWDPTGEAIYYFNPATATNKWIWSRPQIKQIGKHIFCK